MARLDEADAMCARMAADQHGVFTLAQALRAGHSKHSIHRRVERGLWRRILPTVFAFSAAPMTWEGRYMASAVWDAGRAFISGTSAAFLHGVPGFPHDPIEISTISGRRPPNGLLRVRRIDRFALNEIEIINAIPVASPRWTLMGLAAIRHKRTERALDHFIRRQKVSLFQLWDLLDRPIAQGRRGIRLYRDLVIQRTPGQAPTQSELEDMFRDLVRDFHLPQPVHQWAVELPSLGLVHFDFGYPAAELAIEVDGRAWHMGEAFDIDRIRDAEAGLLGIRVVRLTWSMLKWQRPYSAQLVRSHINLSSGQ